MADESQKLIAAVNAEKQRKQEFKGLDCTGAIFPSGMDLDEVQLRYAVFTKATLRQASFNKANLRHVDFRGANLIGASFEGADVSKARFGGALVQGASLFTAVNLSEAEGLDRTRLFFPQADLELVVSEEKPGVFFDGNNLTVPEHGEPWVLEEGYRIVALIEGNDSRELIGKVLSRSELEKKKAEVYPDTALFDDAGYQLEQGFVGVTSTPYTSVESTSQVKNKDLADSLSQPVAAEKAQQAQTERTEQDKEAVNRSDLDLLNDFLTTNLK